MKEVHGAILEERAEEETNEEATADDIEELDTVDEQCHAPEDVEDGPEQDDVNLKGGDYKTADSDKTEEESISEKFEETREHVERLEEVFEAIGSSPETKEDYAVSGLIETHEEFVSQDPDQAALNRFNIAAGQKSEHYEIATYGNLIPLAQQLGHDDVADTLEGILREEQDALEELSEIGEEFDYGQLELPS